MYTSEVDVEQFYVDYFERLQDLHQDFIATFEDLPAEALDWIPGEDMNSLCVLVVHTTGASRFWVGVALNDIPDRNRALEFQARGLSVAELKAHFTRLEDYVGSALERVTLDDLATMRVVPHQDMESVAAGAYRPASGSCPDHPPVMAAALSNRKSLVSSRSSAA